MFRCFTLPLIVLAIFAYSSTIAGRATTDGKVDINTAKDIANADFKAVKAEVRKADTANHNRYND